MNELLVSIVTVCLNASMEIEKTIESILNLEGLDYEYIIKDGNSSDNTNRIIDSYQKAFDQKGIRFQHIVSKDSGIYSAMNQAVKYCSGKWINFMNSGDKFYDNNVLRDVFNRTISDKVGVIYGHTLFRISKNLSFISSSTMNKINEEMPFCHQSTFVKSEMMSKYKFDLSFSMMADYKLFLDLYFADVNFLNVNVVISCFDCNGISSHKIEEVSRDRERLQLKYDLKRIKINNKFINKLKSIVNRKCPIIGNTFFCFNQMRRITKYEIDKYRC